MYRYKILWILDKYFTCNDKKYIAKVVARGRKNVKYGKMNEILGDNISGTI